MQNVQFLSEASKILSSSLDYNVTLTSIANLIVNNIADFCIIDLLQDDGKIHRVVVKVKNRKQQKIANSFYNYPPDPRNKEAIYDAAKRGKPIVIKRVSKEWLKNVSRIKGEHDLVRKLGQKSFMFVPLKSRGRVIGVLTVGSSAKNFSYSQADAVLAEELASRAGLAVDNARLYSEAQDALRARDEFLSIASHELKTPLTSILLQLQMVLQNIRSQSKESSLEDGMSSIVKMLESTEQQSRRLSKLINDLLNVSLVSTGRLQLEKESVNLARVVSDVLKRFEVQLKNAKYKVNLKLDKNIVGIWDKIRIEQVFSNLLSNAIKYGNKKPIDIVVRKDGNFVELIVKDKGIGIQPSQQEYIFERFKRGVSDSDYRGLGVGLYISRQIIEAHGGKIKLKSSKSKGSEFTVLLPVGNNNLR